MWNLLLFVGGGGTGGDSESGPDDGDLSRLQGWFFLQMSWNVHSYFCDHSADIINYDHDID